VDFLIPDIPEDLKDLTNEEARRLILKYERWTDENFALGNISEQAAWDCYFGLLHECDCCGFDEDRKRILEKIDTKKYNPFNSSKPEVIYIARLRLARKKA